MTNTVADFISNNATLFEIDHDQLTCILASEFNKLNFVDDHSYPRNGCQNQCNSDYDLCIGNGWINGGAAVGAGFVGAFGILSYGWYTGVAAGTAAAASGIDGLVVGAFTVGAAHWTCARDLNHCLSQCPGGDTNNEEGGPFPFGCGG